MFYKNVKLLDVVMQVNTNSSRDENCPPRTMYQDPFPWNNKKMSWKKQFSQVLSCI